jgi:hypothetical protein
LGYLVSVDENWSKSVEGLCTVEGKRGLEVPVFVDVWKWACESRLAEFGKCRGYKEVRLESNY